MRTGIIMIINEKQIMQIIDLFKIAIEDNLTPAGYEEANLLLKAIEDQQSEELKVVE
jgi:hypothetical protein